MPYGQPTDADQLFFTTFMVSILGSGAGALPAANVISPSNVQVTRGGVASGLYTVQLSAAYIANASPSSFEAVASVNPTVAGGTLLFARVLTATSSAPLGTFVFQVVNAAGAATDLAVTDTLNVVIKAKFNTVLVQPV